ncbi:MAG: hypothetical protein JXA57_04075 [Armatimonadetes bacterium]|nr:hypothetical protein [Armatimonadota bacterium]
MTGNHRPEGQARGDTARRGGVTVRAVIIGFILIVAVSVATFYVELAWRKVYTFASGVPSMASVVLLFLLTGAMSLPVLRRIALTRRELLTIYSMVLVGGPLVGHGILFWMLPKVIAYYYQARIQPLWETTFLGYVPTWQAPTSFSAVENFFQGDATVPWSLWALPLSAWGSFFVAIFVCTLCAMAIIQRQWISNERLTFPIAQVPLEMVQEDSDGGTRRARLPRTWFFWVGLLVTLVLSFMNSLSSRFPSVPAIPLDAVPIVQWQKVGPLAGLGEIDLVLTPWMIAIAYLIPKELSFSAWFFWIVRLGLTVAAIAGGHTPQRPEDWFESGFPAPHYQAGGAALALFIWVCWVARRHLAHVLRSVFTGVKTQAEEPMSYRLALIGFVLSFAYMVYFWGASGSRIFVGVIVCALIVGYYIMLARIRAETGLGFIPFPLEIQDGLVSIAGTNAFRPRELVTMISTRWAFFPGFGESFDVVTGNALESFKIADASGINARKLTPVLVAGFFLALVVGIAVILIGCYHYGFFGLAMGGRYGWPSWQVRNDGGRIFEYLTNPAPPDVNGIVAMSAGLVFAIFLGSMRLRFWWWPFHPVGYIAANVYGMQWYYMPFFIGWVCKTLVIRYGGLRLYRLTVPLAIGLIAGDLVNQGIWSVVALITQGRV